MSAAPVAVWVHADPHSCGFTIAEYDDRSVVRCSVHACPVKSGRHSGVDHTVGSPQEAIEIITAGRLDCEVWNRGPQRDRIPVFIEQWHQVWR